MATAGLAPAVALSAGYAQAAPRAVAAGQAAHAQAAGGVIATVAGGVGGPAKASRLGLYGPCDVTFAVGSVYVADALALRKINPRTDWLTTPAGNGIAGPALDGLLANRASIASCTVALDRAGDAVLTNAFRNVIQVMAARTGTFWGQAMTAGHLYTVAGNGTYGFSGDGGPATQAELAGPGGAGVDGAGNLLIADSGNNRIRVVAIRTGTFYGVAMTAGHIYTVAGSGGQGFSGDGGPATKAKLSGPENVTVDSAGNLLIADRGNDRIRVVAARTGTFYGVSMTARHIYTVAGGGTGLGDGGPATKASLAEPTSVRPDGTGNLVIADLFDNRIRVVAVRTGTFYGQPMTKGDIYTVAGDGGQGFSGDGGPATKAELNLPEGADVDGAGNLLIADTDNHRLRVVPVTTGTFYGISMTAGHIYTVAGQGPASYSGDGGPATRAQLSQPGGVTVDRAGNYVIADTGNNRIRVVAAATGTFYGVPMTKGDIYTVAGNGSTGHRGNGGPATKAGIKRPGGVAFDHAGNLVIAGGYGNNRVRLVAESTGTFWGKAMTAGDIYTVAGGGTGGTADGIPATDAELGDPGAVAVDHSGNLLISDEIFDNRVRVVAAATGTFYGQQMTADDIYTIASFFRPVGVAVDQAGNVLIPGISDSRIRVLAARTGTFYGVSMTAGGLYVVAGGGKGRVEDGGPATRARLLKPMGVAAAPSGSLVIADTGNGLIRTVSG